MMEMMTMMTMMMLMMVMITIAISPLLIKKSPRIAAGAFSL
jgi:hypothetical protein